MAPQPQKLPNVKKEVKASILRDYQQSKNKTQYLANWWTDLGKKQPELVELLYAEIKGFRDIKQAGAFAHAVFLVYSSLESQLEADEMNRAWG